MFFRALTGLTRPVANDPPAKGVRSPHQEPESTPPAEDSAVPEAVDQGPPAADVAPLPEEAGAVALRSHSDGIAPQLAEAASPGPEPDQERAPVEVVATPELDAGGLAGSGGVLPPLVGDAAAFGSHPGGFAPQEEGPAEETGEQAEDAPTRRTPGREDWVRTAPVQKEPLAGASAETQGADNPGANDRQEIESPPAEPSGPAAEVLTDGAPGEAARNEAREEIAPDDILIGDAAVNELPTAREPRAPGRYRPRLREKSRPAQGPPPAERPPLAERVPEFAALEADLVLTFRPGGWGMDLSLLLRRPEGMPEQIATTLGGKATELSAIDDSLFEPVQLADPGPALRVGIAAEAAEPGGWRWVRTGRRLHVFTERAGVFGFTSVPRVVIGQENVILCESDLANRVLELCGATGSGTPTETAGPGVPGGWRCFRGYWPRHPGSWEDDDIYLALNPLPDAAIEFTGGVATSRSTWITGRPPSIRIFGAVPAPGEVTIDSHPATCSADGQWTSAGWDELGAHTVRYAGLLRRYEIVQTEDDWGWWPAHAGPGLVLAGAFASLNGGKNAAVVLEDQSAWLLGARPGEIVRAAARAGAVGVTASPEFKPVWAVPTKTRRRPAPRLLDFEAAPQAPAEGVSAETVRLWRQIIRDASDTPYGGEAATAELWRTYKAAGRSHRRRPL